MSLLRKVTIAVLVAMFGTVPAFATLPNTIWGPIDAYTIASEANDIPAQITASKQIIDIMEPQPVSDSRTDILLNHYYQSALAFSTLGDIVNAKKYFQLYLPFAQSRGHDTTYAESKINILEPSIDVFQKSVATNTPYFGAKFEPTSGVLYGTSYKADPAIGEAYDYNSIRAKYPNEESILVAELKFGQDEEDYSNVFELAEEHNKLVLLNWDTMSSDLNTAYHPDYRLQAEPTEYIEDTLEYLAELDVDILINFGGKMNSDESGINAATGQLDPAGFISSFRYVASRAKQYDNIGMVWSPADIGNAAFEMFYPGNEYVDWVGISLFPKKYFADAIDPNPESKEMNDTIFLTGENANPVKRVESVVEFMRNNYINKPIMITETGYHHWVGKLGQDTTNWALNQMQKAYTEMLYKYPQIKGINYFNSSLPYDNSYALYDNPYMLALYNELLTNEIFIKNYGTSAATTYKNITATGLETSPTMEIRSSVYYPFANDENELMVEYWSGNMLLASSTIAPYTANLRNISDLTVQVKVNGQVVNNKYVPKNQNYIPGNLTAPPPAVLPVFPTTVPTNPSTSVIPSISKKDIDDAIDILYDEFGDVYGVEWEFDIVVNRGYVLLDVTFDGDEYLEEYKDISTSRRNSMITYACEVIVEELGDALPIEGYIYDDDNERELVEFTYEKGELEISDVVISDEAAEEILETLEDKYDEVFEIEWKYAVEERGSAIGVTLDFDGDEYIDAYEDLADADLEGFLAEIYTIITEEVGYDADVKGSIYDYDIEEEMIEFTIDADGVELEDADDDEDDDRDDLEDVKYDDRDMENALEELEDELDGFAGIEWKFDIEDDDGYVGLYIEFDGEDYLNAYRDIAGSDLRGFLASAYDLISEELDDNMAVKGEIVDADEDKQMLEFSLKKDKVSTTEPEKTSDDMLDDLMYYVIEGQFNGVLSLSSATDKADVEIIEVAINDNEDKFSVKANFDFKENDEDVWYDILIANDKVAAAETMLEQVGQYLESNLGASIADGSLSGALVDSKGEVFVNYDSSGFYY